MGVIARYGIAVDPPRGWSARIYRRAAGPDEHGHPTLHAATVPVFASCGDFGSGVAEQLAARDVLVTLLEFSSGSARQALFAASGLPRPRGEHFHPHALQRTLAGQSGYQRFFHVGNRSFCLYVVLGSHRLRHSLAGAAGELLATVHIGVAGG